MPDRSAASTTGLVAAAAGGVLVAITTALGGAFSPAGILFLFWALTPYLVLALAARMTANAWAIGGAGAAAIAVEAGIRASVFLFPQGSTAAIALVFSPAFIAAIVLPLGALAGVAFGWAFTRAGVFLRIPLALFGAAVLGLTFIGFARPDLFPTTVAARRAALAAIGEPRVIMGADRFTRTSVSERGAWYQAGDFDGEPGDEIARIDHDGADLLDPSDFAVRGHVPFGGQRGRLWSWYSRLQRLDGTLVAVQTGGGYQETEVRTLDNTLLWRYRPNADLPPDGLMPADLDGDGRTEFYASTKDYVARLDANGRETWTRPAVLAAIVDVAPQTPDTPAWIVAAQYEAKIHIWDDGGAVLGELPWPGDAVSGIVDWPAARHVVVAGRQARGLRLDGGTGFDLALPEHMRLQQATSIRWQPGEAPMLAMVLAGPQDVGRWRLRILDAGWNAVYDEVTDRNLTLLVARDAAGRATLLLNGGGLAALRPVDR